MPSKRRERSAETIKFSIEDVERNPRGLKRFGALLVIQGSEADLGVRVALDRPVVIGRDPGLGLTLRDGGISRRHAEVVRTAATSGPPAYLLRDLGSTNGTRVNAQRVKGERRLRDGDKIFVGTSVLRFAIDDGFDADYHARLEDLLATDELTGLVAKRRFDAAFAEAVRWATRLGQRMAVLMMDLDGLKQINDTHGHHMGAFTIREVGQILGRVIGDGGLTTRFGGDEFITFLPKHDRGAARAQGERLRDLVAQHRFEKEGVVVAPTISIGVAALPEDGDSPEALFRAADAALYRAKAAGRNTVAD